MMYGLLQAEVRCTQKIGTCATLSAFLMAYTENSAMHMSSANLKLPFKSYMNNTSYFSVINVSPFTKSSEFRPGQECRLPVHSKSSL